MSTTGFSSEVNKMAILDNIVWCLIEVAVAASIIAFILFVIGVVILGIKLFLEELRG
jgi:uncharacterized membrane protein YtjA (UPF0391 family)